MTKEKRFRCKHCKKEVKESQIENHRKTCGYIKLKDFTQSNEEIGQFFKGFSTGTGQWRKDES